MKRLNARFLELDDTSIRTYIQKTSNKELIQTLALLKPPLQSKLLGNITRSARERMMKDLDKMEDTYLDLWT